MKQEYFAIVRHERNMFSVKTVTVEGKKIVAETHSEPTFLPIAFDELRRKLAASFLKVVEENA